MRCFALIACVILAVACGSADIPVERRLSADNFSGDCQSVVHYATAPRLSVLAVDPADPRTLWHARKNGAWFVSHDSGRSWQPFQDDVATCHLALSGISPNSSLSGSACVQTLAWLPPKPAAGSPKPHASSERKPRATSQVFCTRDAGISWQRVMLPADAADFVRPPVLDPELPQRLYAVIGFDAGASAVSSGPRQSLRLGMTDDLGATWLFAAGSADLLSFAITPPPVQRWMARRSAGRFDDWRECLPNLTCPVRIAGDSSEYDPGFGDQGVNPFNAQQLFFYGEHGLHVSLDGGHSFTRTTATPPMARPPIFMNAAALPTLFSLRRTLHESFLLTSHDAGQHWQDAATPLPELTGDLLSDGAGRLYFAGERLWRSDDAGVNFLLIH